MIFNVKPTAFGDVDAARQMFAPFGDFMRLGMRAVARSRRLADWWLYPVNRLTSEERLRLAGLALDPSMVLAVGPSSLRAYKEPAALRATNDALARVAAVVGPGVGPLGAAAFAREVALTVGEPVLTAPGSYTLEDWAAEASGAFAPWLANGGKALCERPEGRVFEALIAGPAQGVRLVVGHGLGAWIAAKVLERRLEDRPRRLVSIGAAPPQVSGLEVASVIGAADLFGWTLADPDAAVVDTPMGAGHHLHPAAPGCLNLREALQKLENEDPFLSAAAPARPSRGGPAAVSD